MSLTIDSSTPAASQSANGVSVTSLASNTFSPPAGSVIVVFWGNGNTGTNPTSITDSLGSHLSWSSDTTAGSTSTASAGMYWASCPSAQSNMTVTVNFASTQALYILPVVFTGEVSTSLGATTTASPASGSTLTATVTPQAAGSYVFGVFCNGFSTASPTVPSGQTITVNGTSTFLSEATHGTSFWVQYQTATTTGSSVTINDTAPTGGGGIVLAEILAAVTTSRYLLGVPHRRGPLQARMRGFGVSVPPISPVLPTNPGWAPPIISPNSTYF